MTACIASTGPVDGPATPRDWIPGDVGVMHSPDDPMPFGTAIRHGRIDSPRSLVSTFRLNVGKVDLPGLFVLDCRRFIPWTNGRLGPPGSPPRDRTG